MLRDKVTKLYERRPDIRQYFTTRLTIPVLSDDAKPEMREYIRQSEADFPIIKPKFGIVSAVKTITAMYPSCLKSVHESILLDEMHLFKKTKEEMYSFYKKIKENRKLSSCLGFGHDSETVQAILDGSHNEEITNKVNSRTKGDTDEEELSEIPEEDIFDDYENFGDYANAEEEEEKNNDEHPTDDIQDKTNEDKDVNTEGLRHEENIFFDTNKQPPSITAEDLVEDQINEDVEDPFYEPSPHLKPDHCVKKRIGIINFERKQIYLSEVTYKHRIGFDGAERDMQKRIWRIKRRK